MVDIGRGHTYAPHENRPAFGSFEDERIGGLSAMEMGDPHADAQHRVQAAADDSPPIRQLSALQAAANNSAQVRQLKAYQAAADGSPEVKTAVQRRATLEAAGPSAQLLEAGPQHAGLPLQLQRGIERLSGISMEGVKVHYNSSRPAQLQAHALAQGSEIHLGAGQEAHLPHEAWHIVQQRQGRVAGTTEIGGVDVNDDAGLEQEADVMGQKALLGAEGNPEEEAPTRRMAAQGAAAQLKSQFTSIAPLKKNADTPLASLSKVLKPFYAQAGANELYFFNGLGKLLGPTDPAYSGSFDKAGRIVAEIDPASKHKADGTNRNNAVIGPYGHFGVMERDIFKRQVINNPYDGGHLVEHTLMEAQDADVHGNLAPQSAKTFNQSLMRGWEDIPETYMENGTPFEYEVEVKYSQDTYTRTGKELLDAQIVPLTVYQSLPTMGTNTQTDMENAIVTFERWVPTEWLPKLTGKGGSNLPKMVINKTQHHRLNHGSDKSAYDSVFDPANLALNTGFGLKRSNSQMVGGYIDGMGQFGPDKLTVGGSNTLWAKMYQSEPQHFLDQQVCTQDPFGKKTSPLLPTTLSFNLLKKKVSLNQFFDEVKGVQRKKKNSKENLSIHTIATSLKSSGNCYLDIKEAADLAPKEAAYLVIAMILVQGKDTSPFDRTKFEAAIDKMPADVKTKNKLKQLLLDPNLTP